MGNLTVANATRVIGGFSTGNTKMNCPCLGFTTGTCTQHHPENPRSTCHHTNCYAKRNLYRTPGVQTALRRREHQAKTTGHLLYGEALRTLMQRRKLWRFFDSGDLVDQQYLETVLRASTGLDTKVWIPTKRYDLIAELRQIVFDPEGPAAFPVRNSVPDNVCIRVGAWQIDPSDDTMQGYIDSYGACAFVFKDRDPKEVRLENDVPIVCRAPKELTCGIDCTACFFEVNKAVIYKWH